METAIVDVGKSGARLHWGTVELTGPGVDPASGHGESVSRSLSAALRATLSRLPELPGTVCLGTTALPANDAEWSELGDLLGEWAPDTRFHVLHDGVLAHAATLGAPGVVASVGTGTVVMGCSANDEWTVLDGWGPDLGDRGSAFALGRSALRAAYAELDEMGTAPGVAEVVESAVGMRLGFEMANTLARAQDRTARISAIARHVVESDSPGCRALVAEAAGQVAESCLALARRLGVTEVGLAGRLGSSEAYCSVVEPLVADAGLTFVASRWTPITVPTEVLLTPRYLDGAVTYEPLHLRTRSATTSWKAPAVARSTSAEHAS